MSDFKAKMHQIQCWMGLCPRPHWGSLQRSQGYLDSRGALLREGKGREKENGREEREWEGTEEKVIPRVGSHPMSEILKNTLIAELIWLTGAATQTFAPGGKHPHAATANEGIWCRVGGR